MKQILFIDTVANGEQFFLNDFEITKLSTNATPEYQYNLKDHLGNVRLSFTSKVDVETTTATYETANLNVEQSQYLRMDNAKRINSSLFDRTNDVNPTTTPGHAQRLNGSANERYGIAKSLSVMPGDVINAEVYAKYIDPNSSNWTTALANLVSQINANTAGVVIDGAQYTTSTSSFPPSMLGHQTTDDNGAPRAYLNWLVFDRNYLFITGGFKQITTAAKEAGTDIAHELVAMPAAITITQPGYVYIYLSNENSTPVEVFFDEFKVTHTKSPVIQQDDYYPFGLTFNSYSRENSVQNRFLYNQGAGEIKFNTERQFDLGLNVDQSKYRTYDYLTGRWWQIDPLPDLPEQISQSPYQYAWNNPITFSDPNGDCPCLIPAIPYILEGLYVIGVATVGYVSYNMYDRSKMKSETLKIHNEGSFLNNTNPKNPNFDSSKKAALIGTAMALVARLVEKNAKFFGLDPREVEKSLSQKSPEEIEYFITTIYAIENKNAEEISDRQYFGFLNPAMVLSATTYDFRKGIYTLERGQTEEEKAKEKENQEKGKQAKYMLENFSKFEEGTYTWNGNKWVLE